MPRHVLHGVRGAVRSQQYDATKHAVDEMAEDGIDIIYVETAILKGRIATTEKDGPRGTRYTTPSRMKSAVTFNLPPPITIKRL